MYCLILIGYVAIMISFFPSMSGSQDQMENLLDIYPESMIEGFGIDVETFTTIEGFLSIEYFKIVWVIIICILAFSFGASIISKEVDKGTSEFTYTLPLLRQHIVLSKFSGFLVISIFITFVSIYSAVIGIYVIDEPIHLEGWALWTVLAMAFTFGMLAFSTFFGTIFSSKGRVYAVCTGFLIASYLIDFMSGVSDKVEKIHFLSFFKYLGNIQDTLLNSSFDWGNVFVFVAAGIIFLVASLIVAEKRDL